MSTQTSSRPWLKIWTKPRATIREIVSENPKACFLIFSWLYGFSTLLHSAQNFSSGENFSLAAILISTALLALPIGMLGITISSALIYWVGKWIGGRASFYEVRSSVAWSNVPSVVTIFMWFVLAGYFGNAVFSDTFAQKPFMGAALYVAIPVFLIQFAASLWSLVILITSLSEVQGFSGWKALLNLLIPVVFVGIILYLLTLKGG